MWRPHLRTRGTSKQRGKACGRVAIYWRRAAVTCDLLIAV
jgi:hypothetical protein